MKSNSFPFCALLVLCGLHLSYGCPDITAFLPVPRDDSFTGEISRVSTAFAVTSAEIRDSEMGDYFKVEVVADTSNTSVTHVILQTGDKFADVLDIRRPDLLTESLLVHITCEGLDAKPVPASVNMKDTNNRPPVLSGTLSSVLIQSTWDRTVPINWDSPIIVSDKDYDPANAKAALSVSPDWLELEEIALWDESNPTSPRPASFDKSIRVKIKTGANLPIETDIPVTITASDAETIPDEFSFTLYFEDANKGPRFTKTVFTASLTEWPQEGVPIPVNVEADGGSNLDIQLVNPPPYFKLDASGANLNVEGVVPEDAFRDSNNVVLLEVRLSLPDGSQFFSTIAVFLPQENDCTTVTPPDTTECPTSTFNPVTDCPTTTPFDPVTDCPTTSTCNPVTDCPTTTPFDPTTDCPTTTCNPVTDCPTTTPFDPTTDCPTTTCNPVTDCPTTTPSEPATDCPTFNPSTDCPTSTTELPPVTNCPTVPTTTQCPTTCEPCPTTTSTSTECPTTFNPITDCPTTTVDPNNPCPTCEPTTCPTTPPNPTTTECPVTCAPVTDCPTTTVDPNNPCPTCPPSASEDKGSNTGLLAGIGVVSAIAAVSIGAAVYFFLQAKNAAPSVDTSWSKPDQFTVERKPPRNSFSAPKALRASIPNIATDNGFANPAFNNGPSDSAGLEQVLSHSTPAAEDVSPYASASIIDSDPPTTATTNTTTPSSAPMKSALATPKEIDPDYETLPQPVEEKVVPDKPRGVRIAEEVEIMNEPDIDEDDNDQL